MKQNFEVIVCPIQTSLLRPPTYFEETVSNYDLSTLKLCHRNMGKLVQNGNKKTAKNPK